VREEWVSFETPDVDCVFLHRDEFHATYDQQIHPTGDIQKDAPGNAVDHLRYAAVPVDE
jgi:hypothetical protein